MNNKITAIIFAFLAAGLYAVPIPLSKILLQHVFSMFIAVFLYAGAGIGMPAVLLFGNTTNGIQKLTKQDLSSILAMSALDIIVPIFLMVGLTKTSLAHTALLNNFEIVITLLIAIVIFKGKISFKMQVAIFFVSLSSILLSFEGSKNFQFSSGSLYVLGACLCWGLENNCTKNLSSKGGKLIVILKGICSGLGSLAIALYIRAPFPAFIYIALTLLLGFVSYRLSIFFYVGAQKYLGAAKTSACYAAVSFIGSALPFFILREALSGYYLSALLIMMIGTLFVIADTLLISHSHLHTHIIRYTHDGTTHEHIIEHLHYHGISSERKHTYKVYELKYAVS